VITPEWVWNIEYIAFPLFLSNLTQFRFSSFACLSYEYCPKGSLTTLLTESESYDFLTIAQDISNGMAYLHSMNIIHRDLKPDNIFITQDYRAKVADFGLSITDTGGQDLTGETGTYRWMAPEVIRHEKYSVASDTYSFGILLWQLVTRNPRPFDSMQPVQTAFAVAHGKGHQSLNSSQSILVVW
jgi:serine/threonine protein kinase